MMPQLGKIELCDMLSYMDKFPDEIDDPYTFIQMVNALDDEFMKHGIRQSRT